MGKICCRGASSRRRRGARRPCGSGSPAWCARPPPIRREDLRSGLDGPTAWLEGVTRGRAGGCLVPWAQHLAVLVGLSFSLRFVPHPAVPTSWIAGCGIRTDPKTRTRPRGQTTKSKREIFKQRQKRRQRGENERGLARHGGWRKGSAKTSEVSEKCQTPSRSRAPVSEDGWRSLDIARASIWRIRSRVRLK
jgi:hypothetical protein